MEVVRYEILVDTGIGGKKHVSSDIHLVDAVDFYDDLCKLMYRYVSNYKGSIFRGVLLYEKRDKYKFIKAHYYVNNNGEFSDKEVK